MCKTSFSVSLRSTVYPCGINLHPDAGGRRLWAVPGAGVVAGSSERHAATPGMEDGGGHAGRRAAAKTTAGGARCEAASPLHETLACARACRTAVSAASNHHAGWPAPPKAACPCWCASTGRPDVVASVCRHSGAKPAGRCCPPTDRPRCCTPACTRATTAPTAASAAPRRDGSRPHRTSCSSAGDQQLTWGRPS